MKNRVRITICGKSYILQTEEDAAYVVSLARELDGRINAFMDENKASFRLGREAAELRQENEKLKSDLALLTLRDEVGGRP